MATKETMGNVEFAGKYQIFPPLTDEEYQSLKDDIAQHGILVPIEKDEAGNILDGHHRIKAWEELRADGVKVPQYEVSFRAGMTEIEKLTHIRSLNLLRRHLSTEQQKPHWKEMRNSGMTYQAIAEKSGVSKSEIHAMLNSNSGIEKSEITNTRGQKRPARYKPRQPYFC